MSGNGLDSSEIADSIRSLKQPLQTLYVQASASLAAAPAFFGDSFSLNQNVFAYETRIDALVDRLADQVQGASVVSGQDLINRLSIVADDAFNKLRISSLPSSVSGQVHAFSFDLTFSNTQAQAITLPTSFTVGGFKIDTGSTLPPLNVTGSIGGTTNLTFSDADGPTKVQIDTGKTQLDVQAKIDTEVTLTGKVASILAFQGTLHPQYDPEFVVTFNQGMADISQLQSQVRDVQLSDACKFLLVPVTIKLEGVDPLPALDYRTTFRFDLTGGGSGASDSFAEQNPGVYFDDVNVSNGAGPLIADLFKRAGVPILERVNNAIPDDVREILLGTKSLGAGFGNLTIDDVIGANLGLPYDTPLDLLPYGLQLLGVPLPITQPVADSLEKILKLSDLLASVKKESSINNTASTSLPAASSSSVIERAKALGLTFPVMNDPVASVSRILAGKTDVNLVAFNFDFVDEIIKSMTKGAFSKEQAQKILHSDQPDGRIRVDIDTRAIKQKMLDNIGNKANPVVKEVIAYLLKYAGAPDISLSFGLESSINIGVDTHFLAMGDSATRLFSSIYVDTNKPLFSVELDTKFDETFRPLAVGNRVALTGGAFNTVTAGAAHYGGVASDQWKNSGVPEAADKYVPIIRDMVMDGGEWTAEKAREAGDWISKVLDYQPTVRLSQAVGGNFRLGVESGSEPGKLRLSEATGGDFPLYAAGNVTAEAAAAFEFVGRRASFSTGRVTLLSFDTSRVRHNGVGGSQPLGVPSLDANLFAELVSGTVFVYGSSGKDEIEVSGGAGKINVKLKGVTQSFDETQVNQITVSLDGQLSPRGADIQRGLGAGGDDDSFAIDGSVPGRIALTVNGGTGNDRFSGRIGASEFGGTLTLYGGGGADRLTGGAGSSSNLFGGEGPDILRAGSGVAWLDGGDGADQLSGPEAGSSSADKPGIMVGGKGEDFLYVGPFSTGSWTLVGGCWGSTGDGSANFIYGGGGSDLLVAGDLYNDNSLEPSATSGGPAVMLGGGGNDVIYGSPFDDVLVGGAYDNSIFSGVDQIFAGDGANLITPENFVQADDPSVLVPVDTDVAGSAGRSEQATGGAGIDTFRLGASATDVTFRGAAGSDRFEIGTGDISAITGTVNVLAGAGDTDRIVVNDGVTSSSADYLLTPTSLTSTVGVLLAKSVAPSSRFGGLSYDGTAEFFDLEGTNGVNVFDVQPSDATSYLVDGNLPASGFVEASKGDFLRLDTKTTFPVDPSGYGLDTSGRRLSIEARGKGQWDFTKETGHKPVTFESIERFNHVDIIAAASDAGVNSSAKVLVFDAETLTPLFTIDAAATYGAAYRQGVRVATGDLDNDGLPDVAVAPGRLAAPTIKVFNGSPQVGIQGTEIVNLRIKAAATYGAGYLGGVNIAVGDVTGDTLNDIVLTPSRGKAIVKVFENSLVAGTPYARFGQSAARSFDAFPEQATYIGGASVATGDVKGIGKKQVVVGSGVGMTGNVRVFDLRIPASSYKPIMKIIDPTLPANRGGLSVAAGDLDGDGHDDIVTGTGAGSGGRVRAYSGQTGRLAFSVATESPHSATLPTRVAVRAVDGDHRMAVFATWGPDARQGYRTRRIDAQSHAVVDELKVPSSGFSGGGLNIG